MAKIPPRKRKSARSSLRASCWKLGLPFRAFRAEDTPVDLMNELAAADYSHLPELRHDKPG